MSRRQWTHRRLGIGGDRPSVLVVAAEDRVLDEVGARGSRGLETESVGDPLRAMLVDYVSAIDALIEPVDSRSYRAGLPPAKRARLPAASQAWQRSRRTIVPVAAAVSVLVIVVGVAAVPHSATRSKSSSVTVVQPKVVAVTESKSLLRHASTLLTAAHAASSVSDRATDVRLARDDLDHVAMLLPLAPRTEQPALRRQFDALDRASRHPPVGRRTPPLVGARPGSGVVGGSRRPTGPPGFGPLGHGVPFGGFGLGR